MIVLYTCIYEVVFYLVPPNKVKQILCKYKSDANVLIRNEVYCFEILVVFNLLCQKYHKNDLHILNAKQFSRILKY